MSSRNVPVNMNYTHSGLFVGVSGIISVSDCISLQKYCYQYEAFKYLPPGNQFKMQKVL